MAARKRTPKKATATGRPAGRPPASPTTARRSRETAPTPPGRHEPLPPPPAGGRRARGGRTAPGGGRPVNGGLRVRMYRIGFGDFFLLTVPTPAGPQHILIDCGVHAGNIGTMDDCVKDLVKETGTKLALVIATHYHADHLSGFASNYDDFAQFEVGAVWITNRLDPKDGAAVKFQAQLASLANQLRLQLGARQDPAALQALDDVHNALGAAGSGNAKALQLLTEGFKNKPPVYYYQAGDDPVLPQILKGVLTAQLLGPSPKDSKGAYAASDNHKEQYLAAAADRGLPVGAQMKLFEKDWPASASDYPTAAFREYRTEEQIASRKEGTPAALEQALQAARPDILAATADVLDGTLNNQSLVVLFTCQGKKLLFVGDAQWGNWEYWLYGKPVTGKDPGITQRAKDILGSIDFYKVGHHGSTNATPIPAVGALNEKCVAMCSTETGYPKPKRTYGNPKKGTEVPRTRLMDALETRTKNQLVRSDWIEVPARAVASPEARSELPKLPANFTAGDLYVDYVFPR
jgi:beta-lactamase superfamily II metal-dependent hydrolase